jgi:hypothetical protein
MTQQQGTNGADNNLDEVRDSAVGVMSDAQERLRSGANQVAERLPDALNNAQVAAKDAQVALDGMSDDALIAGTGFSIGLAVGLFFGGVNRLLILLAIMPGAAMAATLAGRRQAGTGGGDAAATGRRRTSPAG